MEKTPIQWAIVVKTLIQILEIGIWLTVAMFLWWKIIALTDNWLFTTWRELGVYFADLFGFSFYNLFFWLMCAVLVVMAWRWIMSWASNNWWQTPNNKWN